MAIVEFEVLIWLIVKEKRDEEARFLSRVMK